VINSLDFNDIDMNIIKYPIITDKATRLLANNQYSFVVSPKSDKPSIKAAIIIAIMAKSNCPLKENLIEVSPMQTPISVNIFGKIILTFFFSEITFRLFFGCSIIIF